ncbi:MAG: multiheme c-type cytochrome, partial [Parvularculaceae bacterium]
TRVVLAHAPLLWSAVVSAQETPPTPLFDGFKHMGVASCTNAGCHGDQVIGSGAGSVVGQNEYIRWLSPGQKGAHSRAYTVLWNEHSRRIADNLGIGPAYQSPICLNCHADNVAPNLRGDRFQISDGVGCEACHGGAENWLASHRSAPGHEQNVSIGLYPTELPLARGKLCLGCHLGSIEENQFVSHRIMGAGHPRLKFELDLYTAMQSHHTIDEDYRARKVAAPGAKVWAVGQALALQRTLELVSDKTLGLDGAFPEFVFFDCHACHQPIADDDSTLSWCANPARGLGPGAPTFNDANLIMLIAAARVLDPALAGELEAEGRAVHAAAQKSHASFIEAAQRLKETADGLVRRFDGLDYGEGSGRDVLDQILSDRLAERYTNYAVAEQALFAVQRLVADLGDGGKLSQSGMRRLSKAIADAGEAVESPYSYNQEQFRRALKTVESMLDKS